jgi:hypothetical protein
MPVTVLASPDGISFPHSTFFVLSPSSSTVTLLSFCDPQHASGGYFPLYRQLEGEENLATVAFRKRWVFENKLVTSESLAVTDTAYSATNNCNSAH